jgi:hypothetical protein
MSGIFKAIEIDDQDTQEQAFRALGEIPLVASEIIEGYIQQIGELTLKIVETDRYECIR